MKPSNSACRLLSSVVALSLATLPTQSAWAHQSGAQPPADATETPAPGEADAPAAGEAGAAEPPAPEAGAEGEQPPAVETEDGFVTQVNTGQDEAPAEGEGEAAAEEAAEPPAPEVPLDDGRPPEPKWGNKTPAKGTGMLIAGGTTLGAGLAFTITSIFLTSQCSLDGPLSCKYENQDTLFIPLGIGVSLVGVMLLAVGGGYARKYKKWENWQPEQKTAVAPLFMRGGGGLALSRRF